MSSLRVVSVFVLLLALAKADYVPPSLEENFGEVVSFLENFQGNDLIGWVESVNDRYDGQEWLHEERKSAFVGDKGLIVGKTHKHYGITKKLQKPLDLAAGEVTLQYEVRFHSRLTCSGAYLKFLAEFPGENLEESSPYVVMFGPDFCGEGKVHVIFRHQNPLSGEWEEKHFKKSRDAKPILDTYSHSYALQLKASDQSIRILIDGDEVVSGSLLEDFEPSFNPPKQIPDPDDKKPEDWVDNEMMPDPEAVKPDDWDEDAPFQIPDPSAEIPEDWDEEDDGEWEAPLISNPEYKGKWEAPLVKNPEYQGVWEPRQIENPHFFEQDDPLSHLPPVKAVAIEILANDEAIHFDNILITTDFLGAENYAKLTTKLKREREEKMEKKEARKQEKEARERLLEEGGILNQIKYYVGEIMDLAEQNFKAAVAFIVIGIGYPLYTVFSRSGPKVEDMDAKAKEAMHKKDDDVNQEEDDDVKEKEKSNEDAKENDK